MAAVTGPPSPAPLRRRREDGAGDLLAALSRLARPASCQAYAGQPADHLFPGNEDLGSSPPARSLTKNVCYYSCIMQTLTGAREMDLRAAGQHPADAAAVDAVLTASRSLIAVATRSLGAAAEETTIAQYRALVVLASRGPQRMAGLAAALDVAPSTAGRMCDRLVRKGLIRRHRARADRRAVLVSVTAAGRGVVDQATARRRALIADILARLPADAQRAVAGALAAFADAAGEVPDSQWPSPGPADETAADGPRAPARSAKDVRARVKERR